MYKPVIIFLLIYLFIFHVNIITTISQEISIEKKINFNSNNDNDNKTIIALKNRTEKPSLTKNDVNSNDNIITPFDNYSIELPKINNEHKKPSFNIVSSFKNNIHFSGFYNGYAIVNFTPVMFIQPFGFISIYASHNSSMYVPVKEIKENIKSLIIEGAAVMAVDNAVKFLFSFNNIAQSVSGFALKNIAISILRNSLKTSSNGMLEFKYFYYSVSIKF